MIYKLKRPIISIIAAVAENKALGKNNKLLWHIPEDLKRFKEITMGHPIIMGRKTFESIGSALPGRTNIIITRNRDYQAENCLVRSSFNRAVALAKSKDGQEIFIGGGESVYKQAINRADKLYLTLVKGNFKADVYFPKYSQFQCLVYESEWLASGKYAYKFIELTK
jgi:dihydrofolate reductase